MIEIPQDDLAKETRLLSEFLLTCPEKSGLKELTFIQQEYLALHIASRIRKALNLDKPKRGRPKQQDARRIAMSLAVSDKERLDIHMAAQARGMTIADFMRDAVSSAISNPPAPMIVFGVSSSGTLSVTSQDHVGGSPDEQHP